VVGVGRSRVNKRATQSYTIATIQVPKLENPTYTSLDGNVFGSGLRRAHLRRTDTPSSNGTRHRQERQELHWTRDHDVKGRFQGRTCNRHNNNGLFTSYKLLALSKPRTNPPQAVLYALQVTVPVILYVSLAGCGHCEGAREIPPSGGCCTCSLGLSLGPTG
jgi:hypothetical protein